MEIVGAISRETWGEALENDSGAVYELLFRKANPFGIFVTKHKSKKSWKKNKKHIKINGKFVLYRQTCRKTILLLLEIGQSSPLKDFFW